MNARELWERYKALLFTDPTLGVSLDLSRSGVDEAAIVRLEPALRSALEAMAALEKGAVANPDEKRMVGHYWLRAAGLAPSAAIADEIRVTQQRVLDFAAHVHDGRVAPPTAARFRHVLVIGIGGSALGPQLVADALSSCADRLAPHFLDNTDPDGIDRVLARLGPALAETLAVVISKSGGTAETRNGMLEAAAAYRQRGLDFAKHAVAITQDGSALDRQAREQGFVERFPMWDWVGGRTSVTSTVGLLPAALQGIDVQALLAGAAAMDEATRRSAVRENPAALLALAWHSIGEGRGAKAMVVLPYKDRLLLFSRYLQQLVMESLGKEKDLQGRVVHQGLTVYGNKGSTDQHAFVQQLRDGSADFFVTFVRVLKDRDGREPRGRARRHQRRLPRRFPARHAARAARERAALADPHPAGRLAAQPRHADRALRARGRPVRQPDRHQRLPPARCRGRQEGCSGGARPAAPGRGGARGVARGRHGRGDRRAGRCGGRGGDGPPAAGAPGRECRPAGRQAPGPDAVRRGVQPSLTRDSRQPADRGPALLIRRRARGPHAAALLLAAGRIPTRRSRARLSRTCGWPPRDASRKSVRPACR